MPSSCSWPLGSNPPWRSITKKRRFWFWSDFRLKLCGNPHEILSGETGSPPFFLLGFYYEMRLVLSWNIVELTKYPTKTHLLRCFWSLLPPHKPTFAIGTAWQDIFRPWDPYVTLLLPNRCQERRRKMTKSLYIPFLTSYQLTYHKNTKQIPEFFFVWTSLLKMNGRFQMKVAATFWKANCFSQQKLRPFQWKKVQMNL